jgi:hypothetical protein
VGLRDRGRGIHAAMVEADTDVWTFLDPYIPKEGVRIGVVALGTGPDLDPLTTNLASPPCISGHPIDRAPVDRFNQCCQVWLERR